MSISQNFPNTRPSLSINFARSQTLDPRITFTRTTSGTRVGPDGYIEVIPADQPRFDFDPVTGECLGLLVEESRSNSLLWSEDFSNWTVTNGSVQSNVITAPDGNVTADKLVENSSTGNKEVNRGSITFTSGTSLTYSCFVKASERSLFRLAATSAFFDLVGTNAYFDLTSGTVHSITGGVTSASIIPYPNGWYRCIATILPTSSGTGNVFITLILSGVTSNYTGDGTSGIYIWGAQLEQGSFPTSYIPTSGSTVTRIADNASITGSNFTNFYNPTEWTLMIGARRNYAGNFVGYPNLARINDGTSNNNIGFYGADASNQFTNYGVNSGGTNYTTYVARSIPTTAPFKMIQALKKDNSTFGVDGVMTTTDTSVEMPVGANQLIIGGDGKWGGTIQQLLYYPTALPSNQLVTLTK